MGLIRQLLRRLTWRLVVFWLVVVAAVWLFVEFADEVYEGTGLPFDEPVLRWFETLQTPWLTDLMFALSVLGDVPTTSILAGLVLLALAVWFRQEVAFFVVSLGGAAAIMLLTKVVLARPRPELFPDGGLYPTSTPSFPSGHATGSVAFYLTLYLLSRRAIPGWSWLVGLIGGLLTFGIAVSRLYLQVHYPSDVLAGLALGVAWVLGAWAIFHRDREHRFLLVRLPNDVADRVEATAEAEGEDEDAWIETAIRKRLDR